MSCCARTAARRVLGLMILLMLWTCPAAGSVAEVREKYRKSEHRIAMRDGTELFTAIYTPRDASPNRRYPILMQRTCYSVRPYGDGQYRDSLGPNSQLQREGYIFVYQDVRGCYMSEGTFRNMTPHLSEKNGPQDVDESTDTYDTIQWLLKNVKHHNGRVGQWGISYPGLLRRRRHDRRASGAAGCFTAGADRRLVVRRFPPPRRVLSAACLQLHGRASASRGRSPRRWRPPSSTTARRTATSSSWISDRCRIVNEQYTRRSDRDVEQHGRSTRTTTSSGRPATCCRTCKHVAPAVLIVGGWFDAEDLYGAAADLPRRSRLENPGIENQIVMGPWYHGGWARSDGDHLGNIELRRQDRRSYFQQQIEARVLPVHLRRRRAGSTGRGDHVRHRRATSGEYFDKQWPPASVKPRQLYFRGRRTLADSAAARAPGVAFDEFVSDPRPPGTVHRQDHDIGMTQAYMTDDQRFAARRPDVLVYQTERSAEAVTLCGPVVADLRVSTSPSEMPTGS